MHMVMMTLELQVTGSRSLKEKRARLSRLRHRLGRQSNLAVAESKWHDNPQRSDWCIIALGDSAHQVDRLLTQVECFVQENLDVRILSCLRERL